MPFIFKDVDILDRDPPMPKVGGIWVVDQWKEKAAVSPRLVRIPPPRQQRNADGSFRNPSDNALAFFVIER